MTRQLVVFSVGFVLAVGPPHLLAAEQPPPETDVLVPVHSELHIKVLSEEERARFAKGRVPTTGNILDYRLDHQCSEGGFAKSCCEFANPPCRDANGEPINGGPYYARGEIFSDNDFMLINEYWDEFIPANLTDEECSNYIIYLSTAALPRPGHLQVMEFGSPVPGDVCDVRGEVATLCVASVFFAYPALERQSNPLGVRRREHVHASLAWSRR